ncbi:hypothetical protein NQ314_004237 [Rhamnusium bicolor]|uniref:Cytidyltransferase-like domain-containing protein n=1 Tax=Rhamnusium bicolor TaxID=1586634 RepID=A0AAV8ZMS4_9CUCU|nr:hypothetical protein NQ314_004237 [Rhamnusium bicolor]
MAPTKVILLACGSFNPPTNMHLRMFDDDNIMQLLILEIARDHLHRIGTHVVVGGIVSPVHDAYGKKELESVTHRLAMIKLALENHSWVSLSDWECKQESWKQTRQVLQYHQNHVNAILNRSRNNQYDINEDDIFWIPQNIRNGTEGPVKVKLLCGADLLESFGTPGLWADEDKLLVKARKEMVASYFRGGNLTETIETENSARRENRQMARRQIGKAKNEGNQEFQGVQSKIEAIVGQHGLVVITRSKTNPLEFIYNSDMLTKYMSNITIVTEWIRNEISSTKIRRALRRSESVKYLLCDKVIDYIHKYNLYGSEKTEYLVLPNNNTGFLTPSPSDVTMESPSPTNCMYICNNNLFTRHSFDKNMSVETVDSYTKSNIINNMKHPGQAVKIITESSGEHKIIRDEGNNKEVCKEEGQVLKSSKSYTHFDEIGGKNTLKHSKSNTNLKECKSCDENLIKFIFTKHGIQVISDVETIV